MVTEESSVFDAPAHLVGFRRIVQRRTSALLVASLVLGLYLSSLYSYVLFHSLVEVTTAAVAGGIFMFAWTSRRFQSDDYFLFLGTAYLFVGLLDLLHTLAYSGMAVFATSDTNLPTQLWVATRAIESGALLLSLLFVRKTVRPPALLAGFAAAFALVVLTVLVWRVFPDCFVEGRGLTPFKKVAEYVISAVLAITAVALHNRRDAFSPRVYRLLVASILLTMAAELAFTFYVSAYDLSNLVGHYLKLASFFTIYLAIIHTGLIHPSEVLFCELQQRAVDLEQSRADLEACVQRRTQELADANRLLREEIAEQRRTERELRESEERYSSLFVGSHAPMLVLDPDRGTIDSANPAACSFYGYEDMAGMSLAAIHTLPEPEVLARARSVLGRRSDHFRFKHRLSDGSLRHVEVYAGPIRIGDEVRLFSIVHDVTSRFEAEAAAKALEQQLRQAKKMEAIGTMAGGIAHDFNNILTPMLGYSEIVREHLPADSSDRKKLDEVLRAGARARDLVSQILTFSRGVEHKRAPVALARIIGETLKLLRGTLPSTIELREDVEPGCREVMAEAVKLHQVLMNLCTNAYQAMRASGGVLAVSLHEVDIDEGSYLTTLDLPPGRYLMLDVADTGPGMDAETQERIFEPYFTTKEAGEGTGLGLSIVHGIVKSQGGHISVYSEPGVGTTFRIYLPCIAEGAHVKEPVSAAPEMPRGTERIAVVDDEPTIAEMMQHMLEALGYRVTAMTGSVELLELVRARPDSFDLVITDMTMPRMTGDDLARGLLQVRPDLPIILCTGFSELLNGDEAKAAGIRAFLMKPILSRDLARTVRQVLDRR